MDRDRVSVTVAPSQRSRWFPPMVLRMTESGGISEGEFTVTYDGPAAKAVA